MTTTTTTAHGNAAKVIFSGLSHAERAYARHPVNGKYRGFAALHDLFDANELIAPHVDMTKETWTEDANAITEKVNAMILEDKTNDSSTKN